MARDDTPGREGPQGPGDAAAPAEGVTRDPEEPRIRELERELGALDDPEEIVGRGYERLWKVVTRDRPLVISWFALRAESVTNPTLASTARYVTDRFRALVSGLIDQALGRGRTLRIARGSLEVLILAGFQGLILEYLERGDTPQLRTAIDDFQIWLASVSEPPS